MTERTLQSRVIGHAKRRGWTVAHAGKGFVGGEGGQFVTQMSPGWPDLMLFKPESAIQVLALELKREQGVLTPEQTAWFDLMQRCGIATHVVRPSHLRLRILQAILDS